MSGLYINARAVQLEETACALKIGNSVTLHPTVVLNDADKEQLPGGHARAFRYKSSNDKVAAVGADGTVTAKGIGSCTIYVFAVNGSKAKIAVTVEPKMNILL